MFNGVCSVPDSNKSAFPEELYSAYWWNNLVLVRISFSDQVAARQVPRQPTVFTPENRTSICGSVFAFNILAQFLECSYPYSVFL